MIEFGKWTNVNIDGVNIESGKDGLVFFTGNNAIIRDVRLKTGDDGIFLGGVGFPSVQLEVLGDVSDMEFININYVQNVSICLCRTGPFNQIKIYNI